MKNNAPAHSPDCKDPDKVFRRICVVSCDFSDLGAEPGMRNGPRHRELGEELVFLQRKYDRLRGIVCEGCN